VGEEFICYRIVALWRLTASGIAKSCTSGDHTLFNREISEMPRGTVKWFNNKKGFGFLTDPEVQGDIFVHYSEIKTGGYRTLEPGDSVEYELVVDQKGSRARSVVKV